MSCCVVMSAYLLVLCVELLLLLLLLLLLFVITFMHGIYRVPTVYNVFAILWLLYMAHVLLQVHPMTNFFTFTSVHSKVRNMAVVCIPLMCTTGMFFRLFSE